MNYKLQYLSKLCFQRNLIKKLKYFVINIKIILNEKIKKDLNHSIDRNSFLNLKNGNNSKNFCLSVITPTK